MMDDLILHTSLSMDEIENNFKDFNFFSAFTQSLEEAIRYEKGEPVPDTVVRYRAAPDAEVS